MSSDFQDAMNDNMGTLHHLGAMAAARQAQATNEQRRKLLMQNQKIAANQEKLIEVEKQRLSIEKERMSFEQEKIALDQQKQDGVKAIRKTLADARVALDRIAQKTSSARSA